jgi:hypothetical protein
MNSDLLLLEMWRIIIAGHLTVNASFIEEATYQDFHGG